MTQKEDIQNAVDVMRKGGVILYPYGHGMGHRLRRDERGGSG